MSVAAPVDELLRAEGRFAVDAERVPWLVLAALVSVGGLVFGATMGSFGLRPEQAFYSGVKVPLLLACSSVVVVPSFLVLNTVMGLRDDLPRALRGVFSAQATVALTLAALAPVTAFTYVSGVAYDDAILLNGVVFAIATVAGQTTLSRHYRPLIAANPLHRVGRFAWVSLYVFVAIQLAWVLRPFVGNPRIETRFFREGAWSNAYVEVGRQVWGFLTGS